jgi:hypothetical protein
MNLWRCSLIPKENPALRPGLQVLIRAPSTSWNGRRLGVALGGTRRKPVLIAVGVIVLGVLFAELD